MIEFKRWHAVALVAVAACAVYANSLWNGFAYDDVYIIQTNSRVHQLRDLSQIWLKPYWPFFGSQLGLYRPLAICAFAIEWAVGGGAAWVFHLANVLLHAAVSVLAFLFVERLFNRTVAFAGALVFAIHPLHTEAVANMVGQSELWAALGVLTACLIYVRRPEGIATSWRSGLLILACYALALLAKESAVVLPGLLVLIDFVQRRVIPERASLLRYARGTGLLIAGFILVLVSYLALRYYVLGTLAGTNAAPALPFLREEQRVLNAFRAWPEFVRLLFFPLDLAVDYAPGVVLPVESLTPLTLLGVLLVIGVVLLTLATPVAPRAGIVAGWFLITILPVSNFLFPIGVLIAERTLYLPSLAVCFIAGFAWEGARQATERETRRLAVGFAIVVCLFFGIRTIVRNPDWDSMTAVWKGLSRDHPEAYRAQWLNAINMWNQGRPELADRYFDIAHRLWPRDAQLITEWGNFYIGQRQWDKAIARLEQARAMTPLAARTNEYLAYAYLYGGRPRDALNTAQRALQMVHSHPAMTHAMIAGAHEKLNQYPAAESAWQNVVKFKSDFWLNWAMLARAQARNQRRQDALQSADSAHKKATDATGREVARKLREAISNGCYPAGSNGCDPLLGWQVITGPIPVAVR